MFIPYKSYFDILYDSVGMKFSLCDHSHYATGQALSSVYHLWCIG